MVVARQVYSSWVMMFSCLFSSAAYIDYANLKSLNVSFVSQPGPEKVNCHAGRRYAPIDWNICEPTFQDLDRTISLFPGPQTWGKTGRRDTSWENPESNCQIYIRSDSWDDIGPYDFSFALVKRAALTILNGCSIEAGEQGRGGDVEIAPSIMLGVFGTSFINDTSSHANSTDMTFATIASS